VISSPASNAPSRRPDARIAPLDAHERPPALLVASLAAALLAVGVAIGTFTLSAVHRHGASVPGGVLLTVLLLAFALGMLKRRYWAVLGFEALLVVQMLAAALGIVFASSWYAALGWLAAMLLGGVLFWKLIRVMARIQARQASARAVAPRAGAGAGAGAGREAVPREAVPREVAGREADPMRLR
jgi:hypothetical protein